MTAPRHPRFDPPTRRDAGAPEADLWKAIELGDLAGIARALEAGADPEAAADEGGDDALGLALSRSRPPSRHACARALMRACSPKPVHLARAAASGDMEMLEAAHAWLLARLGPAAEWIDHGAREVHNALMAATQSRSAVCVAALLDWGADARVADARVADALGSTPLLMACAASAEDLVELLAPVSDVDAADRHGRTALMAAASHLACARALLPLCDPSPKDESGRDALERTCSERPSADDVALGICQALRGRVSRLEWIARAARASGIADGRGNRDLAAALLALVDVEIERAQIDATALGAGGGAGAARL